MAPTTTVHTSAPQSKDRNSKNKNNTLTLRKASVDTRTSSGVIQPQTTTPSVQAEAENIQPPPPGLSAEGITPLNQDKDKDARAYERERQRAKHAGEWAKRRARKVTTQGAIAAHPGQRGKSFKSSKVGLDVDVYAVLPQKGIEPATPKMWDGLGAGLFKRASLPPSGGDGTDASKDAKGIRVNLSELVALSQKKPRKLNVDDFEVIPHIRSVIALDDVAIVHDMDLDEPWEHIYANDNEGKVSDDIAKFGKPSYARVVGAGQ